MARARSEPVRRRPRLPVRLREAAEELIDLAREGGGELRVPGGSVIADSLPTTCRCKCAITTLVEGSATVKAGSYGVYRIEQPIKVGRNGACGDFKYTGADWTVGAPATEEKEGLTSVEAHVPAGTAEGTTFNVSVTVKGGCKCGDTTVPCTNGTDTSPAVKVVK